MFDHCAIVIKNKIIDWGAKPFRMFDVWAEMDGYRKVIREAWEQRVNCGNDLERVKMKLKGLKSALKKWRKLGHNNEIERKKKIVAEIEQLDQRDDEELLQEEMRMRGIGLLGKLKALSEREIAIMK